MLRAQFKIMLKLYTNWNYVFIWNYGIIYETMIQNFEKKIEVISTFFIQNIEIR